MTVAAPRATGLPPDRLWSRPFLCAAAVNFFTACNFFMLVPITVLMVADRYDASLGTGGAVAGALLAGGVAARPWAGLIATRWPPRMLLLLVTATMTITTAMCLLPTGLVGFAVLRFLSGFAFGIGSTTTLATAVAALPPTRRGEGTGYFGLSNSSAGAFGPTAGLAVASALGYDAVLVMVSMCTVLGMVAAWFVPRDSAGDRALDVTPAIGLRRFFEPRALPLCVVIFCIGTAYAGIFSFLDGWTLEHDLHAVASLFFLCYSMMVLAVRPVTGRIMDRHGPGPVLCAAMLLLASGLLMVAGFRGPLTVMAAGLVCGAGMGAVLSGATVLAVRVAPTGRVAVTASTFYLFLDAAVAAGPVLLGLLIPVAGYDGMYVGLATLVAATAALFAVLAGRGCFAAPPRAAEG